jgi:uncharacterized protein YjiS (DUF1127 family)
LRLSSAGARLIALIHRHETRSRPRQRSALFALNDAASHVLALLRECRRRSKERTHFAKLDDRMLKDIGLTRTHGEFLPSYALQSWIARSERTYGSKPFEYYGGFPLF